MIKIVALTAALLGGAYVSGVFDYHYMRVVDRPPAAVGRALSDLDIRQAPGAPATDPSRSGGVASAFDHELTKAGMVYTVRSGAQIAVRMFADLEPVDGGKRTKVTTRIERGDAPDDFVAPAFRSKGITTGLFNTVVDAELDNLTRIKADPQRCQELVDKFQRTEPSLDAQRPDNLKNAFANTARAVMLISNMQQELRRSGCDTGSPDGFHSVEQKMTQ